MYNYFADLLRATSRLGDGTRSGVPYLRWIRESAASNKSWDKMPAELLTSSGGGWEQGKGAVGYLERDRGMPRDNMANTTLIAPGTQQQCAQCHVHPHDKATTTDIPAIKTILSTAHPPPNVPKSPPPKTPKNMPLPAPPPPPPCNGEFATGRLATPGAPLLPTFATHVAGAHLQETLANNNG